MLSIHATLALDLQSMTFRTLTSRYILVFGVRFSTTESHYLTYVSFMSTYTLLYISLPHLCVLHEHIHIAVYLIHNICAVVAISKPATLLPFGLPGSMPSFRSMAETIIGHYLFVWMVGVLILNSYRPIHV